MRSAGKIAARLGGIDLGSYDRYLGLAPPTAR
jgi:hypothetical protein